MATITIPKEEYQELVDKAQRYEYFKSMLQEDLFAPPSSRSTKKVIKDIRSSKQYPPEFIESLQTGLQRSDYFTA